MTTRAISFGAEQLYYSLVNSVEHWDQANRGEAAPSAVAPLLSDGGHA
jgi:hypothetical protein